MLKESQQIGITMQQTVLEKDKSIITIQDLERLASINSLLLRPLLSSPFRSILRIG
jgi:hypothetical protein